MTKKVKKEQTNWILEKIPKKEEIAVQFCVEKAGKTDIIAIITREIFGEKCQIYEVNSVDKSLILLGSGKNPAALEEKFVGSDNENFVLIKSKKKQTKNKQKTK